MTEPASAPPSPGVRRRARRPQEATVVMRVTEVPSSPAQGPRLVVWLIQGKSHATIRLGGLCHYCGEDALTELPPPLLERQHDGTSIVCHPSLGGCNRGFARIDETPTSERLA